MIWRALVSGLWCLALGACEQPAAPPRPLTKQAEHSPSGVIVARVNGEPLMLAEVQELSRATGLTPAEALRRLEEERLLAAYAQERGYAQDAQAAHALKQARVRALLKVAVEQGTAPEDVAQAEVAARFEKLKQRDERPELRGVTHVLFKTDGPKSESKARVEAEALLREVGAKASLEEKRALLDAVPEKGQYRGLPVVRESIEARKDALEAPFAEAAFASREPGLVSRVARTTYGFHVILVRDIKPPFRLLLAEHEPAIRTQISIEKRQAALAQLVEELKLKDAPQLDEAFVRRALADDRLLGAAP
jgi:peptidyl-prolyl cis-trans isomerase C